MGKRQTGGNAKDDDFQLAQRCFDRGDFRQAVKHARQASRKSPSDEVTILLETVTLARADELCCSGHVDQCRELLLPLTKTIKAPELRKLLPDLLLRAGLIDQFPHFRSAVTDADRRAVEVNAFDRAVVNITHARTAEVREQASLVRSALEAVERGEYAEAAEFLRGISRNSLAADWRYFVRGLSAWYANDVETVDANWNRLESGRAALRIVEQLMSMSLSSTNARLSSAGSPGARSSADESSSGLPTVASRFGTRASAVLPASVVNSVPTLRLSDGLRHILLNVAEKEWSIVNAAFRQYRTALHQIAPQLLERIARKIISGIVRCGDERALKDFLPFVAAPPDDPQWNRARAVLAENQFIDGDEDLEHAENRWRHCLHDIDRISLFSESEKQIARSLLNTRIGRISVNEIRGLSRCSCGMSHEDDIAELSERAVEFLEHAIAACPACIDPWRELIELYGFVEDAAGLLEAQRRMLKHFPDDFETLVMAGDAELDRGDALQARDYFLRAFQLKPLDDSLRNAVAEAHRSCARKFIGVAEYDTARAELNSAMLLSSKASGEKDSAVDRLTHAVLLAVLELSAGNDQEAEPLVAEAVRMYAEPTAACLQLAIEAARVQLPQSTIARFEKEWRKCLRMQCRSQTAGEIARLLSRRTGGPSPERLAYASDALDYIKRTSRVRFAIADLLNVCLFLQIADEVKLLEKYVKKGRNQFPNEPWFHFIAAEAELKKGPQHCCRKLAFDGLSKVLEICENSSEPSYQKLAETSRTALSFLTEIGLNSLPRSRHATSQSGSSDPGVARRLFDVFSSMFRVADTDSGS